VPTPRGGRTALALALAALASAPVSAQRRDPVGPTAAPDTSVAPVAVGPPLASLLIPGAGQLLQRQGRAVAYLAVEAFALVNWSEQRNEFRAARSRYRSLAREVARSPFGPADIDGSFGYYENMEKFLESGVYDRIPGGALEPETDESTFNGQQWLLARTTFWSDPLSPPPAESEAYRRALDFYARRAVTPEFRWSWRNAQLEYDLYRRTIRRSNVASRQARDALGLMIANHLLSMVDAFVTIRVAAEARPGDPARVGARLTLPWPGARPAAERRK